LNNYQDSGYRKREVEFNEFDNIETSIEVNPDNKLKTKKYF